MASLDLYLLLVIACFAKDIYNCSHPMVDYDYENGDGELKFSTPSIRFQFSLKTGILCACCIIIIIIVPIFLYSGNYNEVSKC